jgi:SAM-dependent methyltransferase
MLALRPDLQITGIDWRACSGPGTVIRGDVLVEDFPEASFDVIVGISSIEHIGLGHYEHDPLDVDGDVHAMQRAARWLTPGGWIYADVPYGQTYAVYDSAHRQYDEAALEQRLCGPGMTIADRWYTSGSAWPATGSRLVARTDLDLSHFNYVAVVLMKA